jgi:hypothetical protein
MSFSLFWGFGWKVASQLGFDFLDGGQTAAQFLWEGFGELGLPGGDGDGWAQAAQGILGDEPVLFRTEKQADGGLVVGMAQEVVHGGEVEIELCAEFMRVLRRCFAR